MNNPLSSMSHKQRVAPLNPFELNRQQKMKSQSSSIKSESSVDNSVAGICPKCAKPMALVTANTQVKKDSPAYMCEGCCVVTPVPSE